MDRQIEAVMDAPAEAVDDWARGSAARAAAALLWICTPLMTIYAIVSFVTRVWAG